MDGSFRKFVEEASSPEPTNKYWIPVLLTLIAGALLTLAWCAVLLWAATTVVSRIWSLVQ